MRSDMIDLFSKDSQANLRTLPAKRLCSKLGWTKIFDPDIQLVQLMPFLGCFAALPGPLRAMIVTIPI